MSKGVRPYLLTCLLTNYSLTYLVRTYFLLVLTYCCPPAGLSISSCEAHLTNLEAWAAHNRCMGPEPHATRAAAAST